MKFESKTCEWCREYVALDPSRVVSDRGGHLVLRDKTGRLHSLRSKTKENENDEQETEQVGAQEGEGSGKVAEENSETEAFLKFTEIVFGE